MVKPVLVARGPGSFNERALAFKQNGVECMKKKYWFDKYPVTVGQFSLKNIGFCCQNCDFEGGRREPTDRQTHEWSRGGRRGERGVV